VRKSRKTYFEKKVFTQRKERVMEGIIDYSLGNGEVEECLKALDQLVSNPQFLDIALEKVEIQMSLVRREIEMLTLELEELEEAN